MSTTAQPPRKRRRKTAAGASVDCFTCQKRGQACDRKRPYCSPCIEAGDLCAGYKTTLTWGVGVASRGKLRGLSCPVASGGDPGPDDVRRQGRKRAASVKVKKEVPIDPAIINASTSQPSIQQYQGPTSAPTLADQQPLPSVTSAPQEWHPTAYNRDQQHSRSLEQQRPSVLRQSSLQHIQTSLGPQYDARYAPDSSSSTGSFSDADFQSPLEFPGTIESLGYPEPTSQSVSIPRTGQSLGNSIESYTNIMSPSVDSLRSPDMYEPNSMPDVIGVSNTQFGSGDYPQDVTLFSPAYNMHVDYNPFDQLVGQIPDDTNDVDEKNFAILDPRFSSPFFSSSPRLQSLMEYYDRHVCPFIVAFDGPENPYRKHILQLSMHNEGLQNAVAALAINNLRMRKQQPPKQMGFVEEITDAFDGSSKSVVNEPTPEETCYKQMSIDQLNMQLTDSRAAQDDSVLATLLILCLFHVCDSGFSKFKTQLAGVQKLLSLRRPNGQSDFTRWVEMFFIWFDVMTSAVNDREMQIKGESLDMLDYSAGLGALEQFSGCDGRLFKLIARLGRLNLLSQGRPVRMHERGVDRMPRPPPSHPAALKSLQRKSMMPRSLAVIDYDNIDGNGWGSPIAAYDDDTDSSPDEPRSTKFADSKNEFWSEWNDVRSRLQAWQMDAPFSETPPPGPELELGQRDMLHINESFRYSALLYTERLGHPVLPSSHPNFQEYVTKALYHITSLEITSCVNKFLLWPLFITGTECVDEGHRNIIRARCIEVHKESGFYNNLSGLEVLEKVWREVGNNVPGMEAAEVKARRRDSEAGKTGRYGQAFRWRKAMDRVDGEYILI